MEGFVNEIFTVVPICEGYYWGTACFDNGSFITRLIAVKDGYFTKSLSLGILSVDKFR